MLTARLASRRIVSRPWVVEPLSHTRHKSDKSGRLRNPSITHFRPDVSYASRERSSKTATRSAPFSPSTGGNSDVRVGSQPTAEPTSADLRSASSRPHDSEQPSLIEQLFPEESKRHERGATREIPRLPIETLSQTPPSRPVKRPGPRKSPAARKLEAQVTATHDQTAVLVLRNASRNLTEEDFRRLIPQGRHIEGWTLDQGDFYKCVPGRDLETLAQTNVYYLLFNSALNAFIYQGHAIRISRLVAIHIPSDVTSPVPPPPAYIRDGLDIRSAIEAYALTPPTQKLEMRLLKPPLKPLMKALAKHGAYPMISQRPDKMPFEVRLTLEGPQLGPSMIRHVLMQAGKARGLSWSGSDSAEVSINRYKPRTNVSPSDTSDRLAQHVFKDFENHKETAEEAEHGTSSPGLATPQKAAAPTPAPKVRTPIPVYIAGFQTEGAARSFTSHWHRRQLPVDEQVQRDLEGELPPIINAEYLW
ncbi:Hypothetical predicted protein [Lecanosticta acicola]|uniref:Uncharacterized protein n=1 Tax=Lecanosticta acicola TaxID=111012 RepID=A0AAI9EFP3_9PEZI|nr:Hypothetical predicted protein [Lecanosticta acicola]